MHAQEKARDSQVIVVTGSSAGIGNAIARRMALQHGARVVVTSRSRERAEAAAREIEGLGGCALGCAFSLERPEDAPTLIDATLARFGRLDGLVNNAVSPNVMVPGGLASVEYSHLQAAITSNLTNVLWLCGKAHPHLAATRGCVVNIGSAVVNRHPLGVPVYTVLKGALQQATRALSAEWGADGIRVNQVNPGFVRSDAHLGIGLSEEQYRGMLEFYRPFHALQRTGSTEDVAGLVAFLLSDQASWMTGSVVECDGGLSVQGLPAPFGSQ